MASKTSGVRKKPISKENNEQMVLIRDETSQLLMLGEASKVSSLNKGSKLVPGVTVTWQDNSRQRWRGPILAIGTEAQCAKAMSTIEKNSGSNDDDTVNSKAKEEQKLQSTITVEGSDSEQMQVNEEEEDSSELSPLHIADEEGKEAEEEGTENDFSLGQTTDASSISGNLRGAKRALEENITDSNSRKKFSTRSLTVPYATFSKKEQECIALQAQVTRYEQEWMPRPKDPKVIQYLIEITDILRGVNHDEEDEDPGELLLKITEELKMSEKQLQECHRKSATATARQIMKFLYPTASSDCKKSLKKESFVMAVIKYTRIANPSDPVADVEIRHAMGNYVAAHTFKNKKNNSIEAKKNDEVDVNNN